MRRLKEFCEASEKHGLNLVMVVAAFPAETEEERRWKERTLAGIKVIKAMNDKESTWDSIFEILNSARHRN